MFFNYFFFLFPVDIGISAVNEPDFQIVIKILYICGSLALLFVFVLFLFSSSMSLSLLEKGY